MSLVNDDHCIFHQNQCDTSRENHPEENSSSASNTHIPAIPVYTPLASRIIADHNIPLLVLELLNFSLFCFYPNLQILPLAPYMKTEMSYFLLLHVNQGYGLV